MNTVLESLEFAVVWCVARVLGLLLRGLARLLGAGVGRAVYLLLPRLRRTGMRNLAVAFPEMPVKDRQQILKGTYRSLGWQLAEFCRMERYTRANTAEWIRYEGLEHFEAAEALGKGVLILTGHLGAWELSSFYHSLMGHPMGMVIRRLDNRRLDEFVNRIRCRHGNRVNHKDDFARGLLVAMRRGESVGILMDTNMTPPQGVFVDFFGKAACTASGLARVALKTGAAVLPGFLVWEAAERGGKGAYVLHFGERVEFEATGDAESDIVALTQKCTSVIEAWVRRYPEQWLWIHRRWKTRPDGTRDEGTVTRE
ncbi:MAG TPA: lysophospholipid acyltransferase family protein [Acidobacteriaceae bacterium]|nr:lysophospholipid acyltransferase family protein [Acidobacteriaceae bacterium]